MTETMFMPLNLRYTLNHLWLREVGRQDLYVGITDYAQKELGRIDFIEIQREGSEKNKGESFGTIYGANKCVELIMPFEGQLLLVNPDIVKHPGELNSDPYHAWIILLTAATNVTEFMSKYLTPGDYKHAITAIKI
jgi:glycine cleavage system H protein